jgi:hypothetical protein
MRACSGELPRKKSGLRMMYWSSGWLVGDQHAQRRALPPPGPAQALPRRGDGARVAVQHADVQAADVHAQLQRRGRDHAVDVAGAQRLLGLAPLTGQVAAPIRRDPGRPARIGVEHVLQVLGQHLDHQPRLREHDGLQTALHRHAGDARGLRAGRGADAEVRVHHRGVPQEEVAFAGRRTTLGDRGHRFADQSLGQFPGVRDGRGTQHEHRIRAVEPADATQPPDHVGDVGTEHTAVGMHLVDDHEAQVLEELRPLGVMRQHALVQHVRVRDHDVAPGAHRPAGIARSVAVEGEGADAEIPSLVQLHQLGDLIL